MTLEEFFNAIGIELTALNKARIYCLGLAKFDKIKIINPSGIEIEIDKDYADNIKNIIKEGGEL